LWKTSSLRIHWFTYCHQLPINYCCNLFTRFSCKKKPLKFPCLTPAPRIGKGCNPLIKGRHCLACRKSVVDFTQMTNQEVYLHLAQASGEVCGRLRPAQLKKYTASGVPGKNFS
jgi:hypothetical protein